MKFKIMTHVIKGNVPNRIPKQDCDITSEMKIILDVITLIFIHEFWHCLFSFIFSGGNRIYLPFGKCQPRTSKVVVIIK